MTTADQTRQRNARTYEAVVLRALSGFIMRQANNWRVAIQALVPVGYEDDSGFHYGAEPVTGRQIHEHPAAHAGW